MTDRQLELVRKWLRQGSSLSLIARFVHLTPAAIDLALWKNLGRRL